MARHRSPRGRRADQPSSLAAPPRAAPEAGAHRSVPTSLRRGTAVVAVTGGAFSLMGATVPIAAPAAGLGALTLDAPVAPAAQGLPALVFQSSVEPVAPAPDLADAADLVRAVQWAEQDVERQVAEQRAAAEQQAATARAAAERKAAELVAAKDTGKAAAGKAASTTRAAKAPTAAPATGSPDCGLSTSGLGAVKSHVRSAAEFLGCLFGQPAMHGVAGRAGASDHPSGLAVDFMVDSSTGNALAECAVRNKDALGISYVIWAQRINHGSGWKSMEDRGGATANHYDHVHVSFEPRAGGGEPVSC